MNKRQKKKREKKRVPVIADEFNLIGMTSEELEEAYKGYHDFVKKYTYRKKYKDLKSRRYLVYPFPLGKTSREWITNMMNIGRRNRKTSITVTQNLNDFR